MMGSSSSWDFDFFGSGCNGIVFLMLCSSLFSTFFKGVGACIDSFHARQLF